MSTGTSTTNVEEDYSTGPFHIINPQRLKKQSWLARHKNLNNRTDDEWESSDKGNSEDESQKCQQKVKSSKSPTSPQPSAFTRASKYRSSSKARFSGYESGKKQQETDKFDNSHCTTNQRSKSLLSGQVRHTAKSLKMSNYGQLKRAVVDQIDFIKQRDGLWKMPRIYDAMRILGDFMVKHNFRYAYLPESQQIWLQDMVKRLDQWETMQQPFTEKYLVRRRMELRHKQQAEKLDDDYYRMINPQSLQQQTLQKAKVEVISRANYNSRIKREREVVNARSNQFENHTRTSAGKARPDESDTLISPRSMEVRETQDIKKDLTPSAPKKPDKKMLVLPKTRRIVTSKVPLTKSRKDHRRYLERSKSPAKLKKHQFQKASVGVKTLTQTDYSMVAVDVRDLIEVLELIGSVEAAQAENSMKLRKLKENNKPSQISGARMEPCHTEAKQKPAHSKSIHSRRRTNMEKMSILTRKSEIVDMISKNIPAGVKASRSASREPPVLKSENKPSPHQAAQDQIRRKGIISESEIRQLIDNSYKGIYSVIDEYIDAILTQEMSRRSGEK